MGINLNPFAPNNIFGPKEVTSVPNYINAPQVPIAVSGATPANDAGIGAPQDYGAGTTWANLQNIINSPQQAGQPISALSIPGAAPVNAATVATGGTYGTAVGGQQGLAGSLEGTIAGTAGPSVADLQLAQGEQANVASNLALLGSQRGGGTNPALVARMALDNAAANAANLNATAGVQRAGEVATAQGQLGSVLGTTAGEAGTVNAANAGYAQQTALANQGVQQQTELANQSAENTINQGNQSAALTNAANVNATRLGATGQSEGVSQNQAGNEIGVATTNASLAAGTNALNAGIATGNTQSAANNQAQILGTIGKVAAAGAAASDENLKTGIEGGDPMIQSYLGAMSDPQADGTTSVTTGTGTSTPIPDSDSSWGSQFVKNLGSQFTNGTNAPKSGPTWSQLASLLGSRSGSSSPSARATPLSFGQGMGAPPTPAGMTSDEAANALPTAGLNFGSGTVPYTPVQEQFATPGGQFEMDPSVVAATQGGALSDKETKKEISSASYERGLRDALATAPGQGTHPLPLPQTSETLPRPMVDAFRRIMADSAPAMEASKTPSVALRPNPFASPGGGPVFAPATPPSPLQNPMLGASDMGIHPFAQAMNDYQAQQAGPQAPPVATVSDEREKTDKHEEKPDPVQPDPADVEDMLDHLRAYTYRYKDPTQEGAAPGRHTGVMAQDLEKSPLGKQFVERSDEGHRMVNYGQMAGVQMAASAYLHDRLNQHERMLRAMGAKS